MKIFKFLFSILSFYYLCGCQYNSMEGTNPDVETYIELLKSNKYDSSDLPAFTPKDIPALLLYRNDKQIITGFPHNPISSLYSPDCTLGMYVLWTIESIRAVHTNSESLILRFPSLNPIFKLKNATGLELVHDEKSFEIGAQAYFDWWENSRIKSFDDFKHIDPLKNTDYEWH